MKKIILCDLDGTLADCSHRLHHILNKPKDWKSFFAECGKDKPITHTIILINSLNKAGFEIVITSARSDEVRDLTEKWLSDNDVYYNKLIMRKAGDYTDDSTLKPSWLVNGSINKDSVLCAFDDRSRVVKSWRDAGIPCYQVADGDF